MNMSPHSVTELNQNHQVHNTQIIDYADQRIYGTGVEIYKFYISKLNSNSDSLFQTPLHIYQLALHWHKSKPMGKNTLAVIMQRISKKKLAYPGSTPAKVSEPLW